MAGLSDMALGDAYVNIMAETSMLQSGLLRAQSMVSSFVSVAGSGLTKGLVGAMIGIPMMVGGAMVYSVKKFMEAEVVSKRLSGAIAMAGGSIDELMPKYEKLADRISWVTKWDDEQVKSAMASALARGLSTKKMEEAIPAATGLAARMGIDLGSAMNMVTRAGLGNVMMLQRYFPQLKQATTATEKWAMVLKIGAAGMPMARGEINTISGALGQMRKAVGEVFESIGEGLVGSGAFKDALQGITDKIWGLKDSIDKLVKDGTFQLWVDTVTGGLRYTVSDMTVGFGIMISVIKGFSAATKEAFISLGALGNAIATTATEYGGSFIDRFIAENEKLGFYMAKLSAEIRGEKWNLGEFVSPEIKAPDKNLVKESWKTYFQGMLLPEKGATDVFLDDLKARLDAWQTREKDITASLGMGVRRPSGPAGAERGGMGGMAEKASFSIISMADQWKKMQEGITKNKDEKAIVKASEKTAKNTENINQGISILIGKVSGEKASPLFSLGLMGGAYGG